MRGAARDGAKRNGLHTPGLGGFRGAGQVVGSRM